ncbi:hypothetical protein QTH91_04495 [Variovorax dokdonensis]|uniref:Uncharacterized protein n=1 Tax=Variovorax dokdonensis TaxID=344883 RepID=A0ABT7N716_9BURK|nr:hypothetical protein [Variovorax dokdonensis]MDM0043734.1 hypothetical protein [Variovorax dokdonensis]
MTSQHLLGRLIRFLNQPLFAPKARIHRRAAMDQRPSVRDTIRFQDSVRASEPTLGSKVTLPMSLQAETAIRVPAATQEAPAATQALRTLEEVRSDLARLREHTTRRREAARQAHAAHLRAMREAAEAEFDPTDLQSFDLPVDPIPEPPAPRRERAASPSGFMPTDFLELPVLRQP